MNHDLGYRVLYHLVGFPRLEAELDLPPKEIDLTHVPLEELQQIFHVGPANLLIGDGQRLVNSEKAHRLEAFCAERIDTTAYDWIFRGAWSDQQK